MTRDGFFIRCRRCASLRTLAHLFTVVIFSVATAAVAGAQTPIATIGLTPGWATFGQALPQGAAPSGLQVGSLLTQTDVKTRWPDGSIRFAVVTVNVPIGGNYAITAAPVASGAFTPALPTASVALAIGSVTYTATLPATSSTDLWLSGALVYEGRSAIAPVSSVDGTAHPFLRVIFDTRVYGDGAGRVDVTVENVLDKIGATTVTYNAAVTVNSQTVFTKPSVQHYYLTRWRKMFAFGTAPTAAITPDMTPYYNSGALPPYLSLVANMVSSPTGASYDILQSGALTTNMPDHGGRAELAPYPDWTARYLVNKNQTQRTFVLANGDLAGSWPIHVREPENSTKTGVGPERLVSINQRPTLWLDERAQAAAPLPPQGYDYYVKGTPLPIREYGSLIPGPGQSPLIPDNAHQPSLAYVPYLLTGDRYYAEEMAFWANYAMIRTFPGDGVRSSSGILENNEVRGFGWGLRNIVDAAAMYPDASPVRSYLTTKVAANLQWLDNYANVQDLSTNPFQILWLFKRPETERQYISMWEQTYLMHAIDRARQQGFSGGLAHRDAIARFQLKLFTSDPDYPRAQAAPYLVGPGIPGASGTTDFTFFTTMAQIWAGTQGQERPFAGYYGPEARMSLLVGIQNGWTGAQAAYDYLWPFIGTTNTYCPDGGPDIPDLACRAGWALALPGASPPPVTAAARLTSPAPGSTLGASSQGFTWDAGLGVTSYRLDVGSTQGSNDIFAGTSTPATSLTVNALPTDGSTIWVRLSSSINGTWQFVDYSFVTATIANGGGGPLVVRGSVSADGTGNVIAGPFNTSAGDLLIAFATAAGPGTGGQTVTISTTGLTWTRVARANGSPGVVDIWRASTPTAKTSIRVSSTLSVPTYTQSLTVVIFAGAAGVGASATAAATGAPSVSLTATAANSLIYGAGNDWDGAIARTLGPNQAMTHQWLSSGTGDTYWVQSATTRTASTGTVAQLNDTAPTSDRYNFAAVEIVSLPPPPVTPTITWPAPSAIVYGTALGAAQLNATTSVPGTFVYTPPSGTVLSTAASQTLSVTFTPTDTTTYSTATKNVTITVTQATPTITWATPASILSGTALGPSQLNATANVPGTFVYAPPSGTVLSIGAGQTLSTTFTPIDATNYTTASGSVTITVVAAATVASLTSSVAPPVLVGTPITWTAQATGGIAPLQYQFWRFDATSGAWVMVQDFSARNIYAWTPGAADVGGHAIHVRVRSATATSGYEAYKDVTGFDVVTATPASVVSVSATPVLPAVTAVRYTWTAVATGGVAPLQYQFWRYDVTGGWRIVQDYSATAAYQWTPGAADIGGHVLHVRVRSVNSTSAYEAYLDTPTFQVIPPATLVSVSVNAPSPVTYGTPMTWTAVATGGVAPIQYQFWRYDAAVGAWAMARDYNAVATYSWTPTAADVGTHAVHVRARSANSPQAYDSYLDAPSFEVVVGNRAALQSLMPDHALPSAAGTTIRWTAVATGGTTPLQFQFWRYDASGGWRMVQDYSSSAVYSWTPVAADVGTHALQVRVRSAGSLVPYEGTLDGSAFSITP